MIDWDPIPSLRGELDFVFLALVLAVLLVVVFCFVGAWTVGSWIWSLA